MKTWRKVFSGSKSGGESGNQNPKSTNTMIDMDFDMVPDLFCVLSIEGGLKNLSYEWESMSGFTIQELRFRPLTEFIHPDDVEGTIKALEDISKGITSKPFLNRFFCKDNSCKWLEWRVKASKNNSELYAIAIDITERRQKEYILRESERKYEAAFTTSPDAVTISKMDGTYIDTNVGFNELTGYSREQVIGTTSLDLGIWANPDDREKVVKILEKEGCVNNFDSVFRSQDRSLKTVLISASLIRINNEPHILAVHRDITSWKLTEKALRVSENRFRQIAENSEDIIWEVDTEGRYIYCNEIIGNILGYKVEDVVDHKYFYEFYEPSEREELKKEAFITFDRKEKFRNFINYNIHKDGHTVILETNGSPILNKKGELIGYRGTDTDITKRIMAETALRESEEKYRLLAVNTTDVIWTMNLQGEFTYISPSVQKFLDLTQEEALQKNIDSTLTPESAAIAKQILSETLELIKAGNKQIIRTLILEFYCKNGSTVWGELTVNTFFNDNQQLLGFVGISRDITERRKAEQKLIQTMAAVESASDAIGISDANNQIIYRNKALADLFEYETSEELQAAGGWQVCFKDPMVGKEIYDHIIQGKSWTREIEMVTKSRRVFPAFVRADTIHDDNNNIIGLLGIITDITERNRSREKLQNSEQLFRSLAEYSPNMILIIIKDKIYYVNQLCEKKLGFTKEELYAPDFDIDSLCIPEHLEVFKKNLHLSSIGKEVKPFELLMTDRGGKVLYTMVITQPIQIGEEQAILGVIVDISEQRWAEDIVKQKAHQIDNFFKIMVDRELKLVNLKKEVNQLLEKFGKKAKYIFYDNDSTQTKNSD